MFLNRTQSSHHCNDSLNKLSPSLASNNCCHSYCSRVLPSTQTVVPSILSSSLIQQQNGGRRHQTSGPTSSSNSSLVEDEQQGNRKISNGDHTDCTTKLTCTVTHNEGIRRKKSASLNSPANSGMNEIKSLSKFIRAGVFFWMNRKSSNCWWTRTTWIALVLEKLFRKLPIEFLFVFMIEFFISWNVIDVDMD